MDASGNLVTADGQNVQGWNVANGVLNTGGAVSNINLPANQSLPPAATTQFSLGVNLASGVTVGSNDATFSSPIQVFDSQGNAHTLTATYTETAPNTWSYSVTIPSSDLATPGTGATTEVAKGTLTFDGNGVLTSPSGAAGSIPIAITGLANGASDLNLTWNLYDANGNPTITQNTQVSANLSSSQNGAAAGQLSSMSIGANGEVVAKFSNGSSENVAQIALASILNPDSLQQLDGNSFAVTGLTAAPVIGTPGTGARGAITGGALETSTVDIATEFTNLLSYERGYQANSKVITTEDGIIQQTVALIPAQ